MRMEPPVKTNFAGNGVLTSECAERNPFLPQVTLLRHELNVPLSIRCNDEIDITQEIRTDLTIE